MIDVASGSTAAYRLLVSLVFLCCASASASSSSPDTATGQATWAPAFATSAPEPTATSPTPSTRTQSGPVTTAPVYLPYYVPSTWSALRGSILSSDDGKDCTTYTVFCQNEPSKACDIALDFPFIFAHGPKTVEFHGTYTSTFIANIACALDGRTAATCSGYSSFKSGYKKGHITGPTEFSWTSTLTGTDVEWGVLTMSEIPTPTGGDKASVDVVSMPPAQNTALLFDTPVGAASAQAVGAWAVAVVAASALFAGLLL